MPFNLLVFSGLEGDNDQAEPWAGLPSPKITEVLLVYMHGGGADEQFLHAATETRRPERQVDVNFTRPGADGDHCATQSLRPSEGVHVLCRAGPEPL